MFRGISWDAAFALGDGYDIYDGRTGYGEGFGCTESHVDRQEQP